MIFPNHTILQNVSQAPASEGVWNGVIPLNAVQGCRTESQLGRPRYLQFFKFTDILRGFAPVILMMQTSFFVIFCSVHKFFGIFFALQNTP